MDYIKKEKERSRRLGFWANIRGILKKNYDNIHDMWDPKEAFEIET